MHTVLTGCDMQEIKKAGIIGSGTGFVSLSFNIRKKTLLAGASFPLDVENFFSDVVSSIAFSQLF